ncbi:MAG: DNA alkylation repair protein [Anaerocolumna aminovalerica]|uniref:DNA alkylation repair protein n=1 Tax=Anaerocolumna aminovalerica TaxID=1527 RepID=UPI002907914D|nr:DNA alkylation repair protein [Anaerocolumna aminovalerica]MDU6264625.1 DNA alkylation repair protein [Anaerocolumna aminovalerica]
MNRIREELFNLADEKYRLFQMGLCPDTDGIIGVRLPVLRKLAKEIAKGDWRTYLKNGNNQYFEEIMLTGMVIGCVKTDMEEILKYVGEFVPQIDNWAVCDSFCAGLKFTKLNKSRVWDFLQPYLFSKEEFQIRFGVVMLLDYYIEDDYIDRILNIFNEIDREDYYVKMAVAWAVSMCFVKYEVKTIHFLEENELDDFTYNKAIQKIIESLRVDQETKTKLKKMKRTMI